MKKTLIPIALVFALIAVAPSVFGAGSQTASLPISARVDANCTLSTAGVTFGAYDPVVTNAVAALNATGGSVTIACTKGSVPKVSLGLGSHFSGTTRRMLGGTSTDFLTYELYQPPNATSGTACSYPPTAPVWGTAGVNVFSATSPISPAPSTYNVCGTIAGGQNVGVDLSYADSILATVNF